MTREQLEALIRRAFAAYNVRPATADVNALLTAADSYATAQQGITAERRAELARALYKPRRKAVSA